MLDLTNFDQNGVANPNNNVFGLPSTEENADLIIINVPWEVTVSYGAGTARAPESILKASMQVDLYDPDYPDMWKRGFYLQPTDRTVLLKSDFLRKEAELYIDYISKGEALFKNQFMCRTIREVNEGGGYLNNWVYEQAKNILISISSYACWVATTAPPWDCTRHWRKSTANLVFCKLMHIATCVRLMRDLYIPTPALCTIPSTKFPKLKILCR